MFHLSKKARKVIWLKACMRKQAKGSKSFDLIRKNIFCIHIMAAQFKNAFNINNTTQVRQVRWGNWNVRAVYPR